MTYKNIESNSMTCILDSISSKINDNEVKMKTKDIYNIIVNLQNLKNNINDEYNQNNYNLVISDLKEKLKLMEKRCNKKDKELKNTQKELEERKKELEKTQKKLEKTQKELDNSIENVKTLLQYNHESKCIPSKTFKEESSESSNKCCICMENEKDHAYNTCGHMCVCSGCLQGTWRHKCPICKQDGQHCIKIYR